MLSTTREGKSSFVDEDTELERFKLFGQQHRDRKSQKLDLNQEAPKSEPNSLNASFTGDLQVPGVGIPPPSPPCLSPSLYVHAYSAF